MPTLMSNKIATTGCQVHWVEKREQLPIKPRERLSVM